MDALKHVRPHGRSIGHGVVEIATLQLRQLAIGLLQALPFPAAQSELDRLRHSSGAVAALGIEGSQKLLIQRDADRTGGHRPVGNLSGRNPIGVVPPKP